MDRFQTANASDEARVLARSMLDALLSQETDDAERLYGELCELEPRAGEMLIYPMMIAIQRGRLLDFYRDLRDKGEDYHPEMQALCLQRLGDRIWYSFAERAEATTTDPVVRRSMRALLGRSEPLE